MVAYKVHYEATCVDKHGLRHPSAELRHLANTSLGATMDDEARDTL